MFEAGAVTFLRTILIIVLVYYASKLLFRFLIPILLKKFVQKQQEKFHNANSKTGEQNSQNNSKKDNSSNGKDTLGEYVDYEEVD